MKAAQFYRQIISIYTGEILGEQATLLRALTF